MRHIKKILDLPYTAGDGVRWITRELEKVSPSQICAPVWFDIETTGLSPQNQEIYLIGAVNMENQSFILDQWFSDGGAEEEKAILGMFFDSISENTALISFNGDAFDLPFIHKRSQLYGLEDPAAECVSLDLYRSLRNYKKLLSLSGTKQISFEQCLGADSRSAADGRECIRLYRQYAKAVCKRDSRTTSEPSDGNSETEDQLLAALSHAVLQHNEEDLCGLIRIGSLLSCSQLGEGRIRFLEGHAVPEGLLCLFETESPVPVQIQFREPGLELYISDGHGKALLESWNGKCRLYHKDYKNYDYLPGEDMAVHKSLSAYIDRSLKKSATPLTCYTPVACTQELAEDPDKCTALLQSILHLHFGQDTRGA
ncbi:MAG: ribonuclease H-like domain-containing protein [Blautia sp.]|nr:ribonuclease H-like domain-containing protein [Blautia sp.]